MHQCYQMIRMPKCLLGYSMEDKKFIGIIYTAFMGLLLALFVGTGINTFYAPPKQPEYPADMMVTGKELTAEQAAQQRAFDARMRAYEKTQKMYNRNVSMAALGWAVVLLLIGIITKRSFGTISNGLTFGGLCTLLYSIVRGLASQDSTYLFIVASVSLVIIIGVGYIWFVKSPSNSIMKPA